MVILTRVHSRNKKRRPIGRKKSNLFPKTSKILLGEKMSAIFKVLKNLPRMNNDHEINTVYLGEHGTKPNPPNLPPYIVAKTSGNSWLS